MKIKMWLITAAGLLLSGVAFAQDEDLIKLLQDDTAGEKDWKTGFNGQIPMETIIQAIQGTKSGLGSELNADDEDYKAAAAIIASLSNCTDTSCEITGNDDFLGKGTKLDAAINMVENGKDKGLKIDLKLIDTLTGKVLKTMSRPFDPGSKGSLNEASLAAAKGLLSGVPARAGGGDKDHLENAADNSGYVPEDDAADADAAYRKHYAAGLRSFNKKRFRAASKEFRLALEQKETRQARAKLNESERRIKAAARP